MDGELVADALLDLAVLGQHPIADDLDGEDSPVVQVAASEYLAVGTAAQLLPQFVTADDAPHLQLSHPRPVFHCDIL